MNKQKDMEDKQKEEKGFLEDEEDSVFSEEEEEKLRKQLEDLGYS